MQTVRMIKIGQVVPEARVILDLLIRSTVCSAMYFGLGLSRAFTPVGALQILDISV